MHKCILPVQYRQDKKSNSEDQPSTEATPAPDLDDTATGNNDADANKFDQITPTMAQELINRYRAVITDLACWESNLKRDNRGYCRVTLRKLHARLLIHQLALIADNRGAELKTTLGTTSVLPAWMSRTSAIMANASIPIT
ncbi:hypothetical protein V1504DRAFT_329133 [Lipomyces starkeyi]